MARRFDERVELPNHKKVEYTLSKRQRFFLVRFTGPTGNYLRMSTGLRDKAEARLKAHDIIARTYCQTGLRTTWSEFDERLRVAMTANNNRFTTYDNYSRTLKAIRVELPEIGGPFDIDLDNARTFKDRFLAGSYKRSKAEDGKRYPRKPRSFNTHLINARAIWGKWFKELGMGTQNPWASVSFARLDRRVPYVPDEEVVTEFFKYVKAKFDGWELPILFLKTKALLGCRLLDLCTAWSGSLRDGKINLGPDILKARDFRSVILPENLYQALDELKGGTYLWQRFSEQRRDYYRTTGRRLPPDRPFDVRDLYDFIQNQFNKFQEKTGMRINSHTLRRRAITKLYQSGVPAEVAAKIIGMDVRTMWRHYLDMDKIDTAGKLASMAPILIPEL
jgi:hypothetical protein